MPNHIDSISLEELKSEALQELVQSSGTTRLYAYRASLDLDLKPGLQVEILWNFSVSRAYICLPDQEIPAAIGAVCPSEALGEYVLELSKQAEKPTPPEF